MRRLLTSLLLFFTLGCGAKTVKPFVAPEPLPLRIIVFPQIVQMYSDFRFTCMLPDDAEGAAVWGIVDIFHSEHKPLDRKSYNRIVTAPCHTLQLYCGFKEPGAVKPKMVTHVIEPVGECRDAGR